MIAILLMTPAQAINKMQAVFQGILILLTYRPLCPYIMFDINILAPLPLSIDHDSSRQRRRDPKRCQAAVHQCFQGLFQSVPPPVRYTRQIIGDKAYYAVLQAGISVAYPIGQVFNNFNYRLEEIDYAVP